MRVVACVHRLLAMAAVCCCAQSCVQRRLTIRSNPPGAYVYVDDYEIGITPCSTDFIYYGTRQFRLVREGYETLTVEKKIWGRGTTGMELISLPRTWCRSRFAMSERSISRWFRSG